MLNGWHDVALGEIFKPTNQRLGAHDDEPAVFSVTKYDGVVFAQDYFGKRIASDKLDDYKVLNPGDWAYSTIHIDEGSIARNRLDRLGVVSPMYTTMRFKSTLALPYYCELILRSPRMLALYRDVQQGSINRRRSLPWRVFAALTIRLPSVGEQRRIVDLISALDDSIDRLGECTAAAIQAHDAMRRYLLAGTPEWSQKRIGEVAQAVTGRAFPARFQGRAEGVYPYIKCSDMNADGQELVMSEAANWIDDSVSDQLGAKILPTGTVIFPILGAALATEKRRVLGLPAAFDQNVMGLVPGPLITSDFLLAVMSETSLARLSQQGAVPSVNQSIVSSIAIRLPSLDEQRRIGGVLAASAEGVRKARQASAALRAVREHALGSLLSGEHEIPESYDELMGVAS